MTRRISALVAIAALAIGVSLFAAPSTSHAIVISSIEVTVGTQTWCGNTGGACAAGEIKLWDLSQGGTTPLGVPITNGQSLTLAQTGGTFSFDTSDFCFSTTCATPVILINGARFLDTFLVLAANNAEPVAADRNAFNEAQDYFALTGTLAGVSGAFAGYFDNLHTNACGSGIPGRDPDGNCMPEPFFASASNILIGTSAPEFDSIGTNHPPCTATSTSGCWDSGVIQIRSAISTVPEPSTLLLLGTGLMGLAAYGRKHLKKNV